MSDPLSPEVREWIKGSEAEPPDAEQSARLVMARLPKVRQRRRWWPFPVVHRPPRSTPGPADAAPFHSHPIPATNGQSPTAIRRTQTMLSPAKAITAGALVFAIGGALLIAQPFDQQTSLPAAETADERMAPAEFTGTWDFSGLLIPASNEHVGGGLVEARGGAWHHGTRDITDPRFDGDVSIFPNSDSYVGPDTGQLKVWNEAWRVENDEGTWQGEPTVAIDFPDGETAPRTSVFYGEGAYEGLVAVVELTPNGSGWDLRGVIFDGALPPDPEPRPIE